MLAEPEDQEEEKEEPDLTEEEMQKIIDEISESISNLDVYKLRQRKDMTVNGFMTLRKGSVQF